MDDKLIIVSDCCANTPIAEANLILIEKVFPAQANVLTVQQFLEVLGKT